MNITASLREPNVYISITISCVLRPGNSSGYDGLLSKLHDWTMDIHAHFYATWMHHVGITFQPEKTKKLFLWVKYEKSRCLRIQDLKNPTFKMKNFVWGVVGHIILRHIYSLLMISCQPTESTDLWFPQKKNRIQGCGRMSGFFNHPGVVINLLFDVHLRIMH